MDVSVSKDLANLAIKSISVHWFHLYAAMCFASMDRLCHGGSLLAFVPFPSTPATNHHLTDSGHHMMKAEHGTSTSTYCVKS